MSLFRKEIPYLVDTGCELTLVPKDLLDHFPNVSLSPSIRQVWAANNTPIRIDGKTRLPFFLNDRCVWTTALVSEDVEEVMLGIDWLEEHGCVWDFKTGDLSIDGQPVIMTTRCSYIRCRWVLAQGYQEIPPRSQTDVTARVTLQSVHDPVKDVIIETNQVRPGLYVGRTLLPPKHRDVKVCVVNTTTQPQYITSGSCLGHAATVTLVTGEQMDPRPRTETPIAPIDAEQSIDEIIEPVLDSFPTDITDGQKVKNRE